METLGKKNKVEWSVEDEATLKLLYLLFLLRKYKISITFTC